MNKAIFNLQYKKERLRSNVPKSKLINKAINTLVLQRKKEKYLLMECLIKY